MTLLSIVLALILERLLSHLQHWREHALFARHVRWAHTQFGRSRLWNSSWIVVPLLLPTLLVVGGVQYLLADAVYGLLGFVFSLLLLLLCLGPRDLGEQVRTLIRARKSGDVETQDAICDDLRCTPARAVGVAEPDESRSLLGAIFVQAHERMFAILLWFFVLGPLGAVAYRMAAALPRVLAETNSGERAVEIAARIHGILAWAPARITGVLYALAGSTDDAFIGRRAAKAHTEDHWVVRTWRQLAAMGLGALNVEEGDSGPIVNATLDGALEASMAVRFRALMLWLAVLALPTIGGWLA